MSDDRLAKIEARLDRLEGVFRLIADSFDVDKPQLPKPIPTPTPTATPTQLPTAWELDQIPWTDFRNRPGAWFFSHPRDAVPAMDKLRAALDAAGHELEIGGQVYKFNDAKHDFVGRYPKGASR